MQKGPYCYDWYTASWQIHVPRRILAFRLTSSPAGKVMTNECYYSVALYIFHPHDPSVFVYADPYSFNLAGSSHQSLGHLKLAMSCQCLIWKAETFIVCIQQGGSNVWFLIKGGQLGRLAPEDAFALMVTYDRSKVKERVASQNSCSNLLQSYMYLYH